MAECFREGGGRDWGHGGIVPWDFRGHKWGLIPDRWAAALCALCRPRGAHNPVEAIVPRESEVTKNAIFQKGEYFATDMVNSPNMKETAVTKFSKDQLEDIDKFASALSNVQFTEREMEDMRALYMSPNGLPIERYDSNNRPQSREIQSSKTLGSKIKRAIGGPASGYGMSIIGHIRSGKWCMQEDFRAAVDRVQLFDPVGHVFDVHLPDAEFHEDYNEEDAIEEILNSEALTETEREQLVLARVGQGEFRSSVALVSPTCRLTGLSDARFLRASHIKPWRACTNDERLDGNNGLMLAPHVDHLFDQGYISFENDGSLLVSPQLPADVLKCWSLKAITNLGKLNERQASYMAYHREHEFMHR